MALTGIEWFAMYDRVIKVWHLDSHHQRRISSRARVKIPAYSRLPDKVWNPKSHNSMGMEVE